MITKRLAAAGIYFVLGMTSAQPSRAAVLPMQGTVAVATQVGTSPLTVLIVVDSTGQLHFYNGSIGNDVKSRLGTLDTFDFKVLVADRRLLEYAIKDASVTPTHIHFVTVAYSVTYDITKGAAGWVGDISGARNINYRDTPFVELSQSGS